MAFSEALKLKVRRNAAFRCCRCQSIGIQIHHIIPQEFDGPDTFDNAAPLCPSCHDYFGANPVKRKEITEMRDWWYEIASAKYGTTSENTEILEKITEEISALKDSKGDNKESLADLKQTLKQLSEQMIEKLSSETAIDTASELIDLSNLKKARVSDLKAGPIRHARLPRNYLNRIMVIYWVFSEYFSVTPEETIENFKKDAHPEREIEVWEAMASVILALKYKYSWSKQKLQAATGIILMLSSSPHIDEVAKRSGLDAKDIKLIVGIWGNNPHQPITIRRR